MHTGAILDLSVSGEFLATAAEDGSLYSETHYII